MNERGDEAKNSSRDDRPRRTAGMRWFNSLGVGGALVHKADCRGDCGWEGGGDWALLRSGPGSPNSTNQGGARQTEAVPALARHVLLKSACPLVSYESFTH